VPRRSPLFPIRYVRPDHAHAQRGFALIAISSFLTLAGCGSARPAAASSKCEVSESCTDRHLLSAQNSTPDVRTAISQLEAYTFARAIYSAGRLYNTSVPRFPLQDLANLCSWLVECAQGDELLMLSIGGQTFYEAAWLPRRSFEESKRIVLHRIREYAALALPKTGQLAEDALRCGMGDLGVWRAAPLACRRTDLRMAYLTLTSLPHNADRPAILLGHVCAYELPSCAGECVDILKRIRELSSEQEFPWPLPDGCTAPPNIDRLGHAENARDRMALWAATRMRAWMIQDEEILDGEDRRFASCVNGLAWPPAKEAVNRCGSLREGTWPAGADLKRLAQRQRPRKPWRPPVQVEGEANLVETLVTISPERADHAFAMWCAGYEECADTCRTELVLYAEWCRSGDRCFDGLSRACGPLGGDPSAVEDMHARLRQRRLSWVRSTLPRLAPELRAQAEAWLRREEQPSP
jgi:hypothetical protein